MPKNGNPSPAGPPRRRPGRERTVLDRRRRRVSRISLYGSLAVIGIVLGLLLSILDYMGINRVRQDWEGIEDTEEVRLLQEYVRIDTSARTGDVLAGARFLQGLLTEAGIDSELEIMSPKEANLWAILEGESPKAIVLHNHIDVEDIHNPDQWFHPPFSGTIDRPWMYGRGTFDMKSVAIAQLMAFIDLAKSDRPLARSVIFLATTGEETGSELGTQWILSEHPELAERFELVLTEGGILEGRSADDLKYWGTEFGQKRYVDIYACSPSRQRLEELRQDIIDFGRPDGPLRLVPDVARALPIYARSRDLPELREWLSDPEAIVRDRGLFEMLPGYLQAMFRNELYASYVREAPGGGGFVMPMKAHLLPGLEFEAVRGEVLPEWLVHGVDLTVYEEPASRKSSAIDHPILATIDEVLDDSYPGVDTGPIFLPWTGTDARFFRAHGIQSFGFTPFVVLTTDALKVSGSAERIALPGYVEGVDIYRRLLVRLTEPDAF